MNKKIFLLTPPFELANEEKGVMYPIGIAYLTAVLEKEGYNVIAKDFSNISYSESKKTILNLVKDVDIVCLSMMVTNRISSFDIIREIRDKWGNKKKIILGGVHPTLMYEQLIKNFSVDFIVIGEGEKTIIELIKNIENTSKLKKVRGICFRIKDKIIITPKREKMTNEELNKLPFPKHELFEEKIKKWGYVYIITSRGCPFDCVFCSSSQYWGRCWRRRSAQNVLEEIRFVVKKFPYIKKILFCDDEFLVDNERIVDICKGIIDLKIKIKWECQARASSINSQCVRWMKLAGCERIYFGVESGSQKILDNANKRITLEQMINAIKIVKNEKIIVSIHTIIGLPGENKESVEDTLKLLKKIKVHATPAILQIYPGTKIYEMARARGMKEDYWLKDNLVPFYLYENSKLKLIWWSNKISFLSKCYQDGTLSGISYLIEKVWLKMKISNIKLLLRRYI